MKPIVFFSCVLLISFAEGSSKSEFPVETIGTKKEVDVKSLRSVGDNYIALLNRIGAEQNLSHENDASALCVPDCQKIVNGAVWYKGVEHFVPQLLTTGEKVGFWRMEALDVIPGKDERTVVIRFLVHTEKAGVWNTLVILRCNSELLITEINEIFNSYEGSL